MNYSAIYELVPPTDSKGNDFLENNSTDGPHKSVWSYIATVSVSLGSNFISDA